MLRRRACSWMVLPAFLALCSPGAFGSGSGEGQYILERLRERDAMLDNAALRYQREYEVRVYPASPAIEGESYTWLGVLSGTPARVKVSCQEELVVRGEETTIITHPEETAAADGAGAIIPYQKRSTVGGVFRHLSLEGGGPAPDSTLDVSGGDWAANALAGERMEIEFAHGIGIGKRIKDIDSVTRTDGAVVIKGSIQIWTADDSRFEIELDDDYVVRKAVIESNVRGNLTRFEVSTEGSLEENGLVLAEKGTFKRIAQGWLQDGVKGGRAEVTREFSQTCQGAQFNLSDDEYARLTTIEITPGTWVNDSIAGLSYRVAEAVALGPAGLDSESLLDGIAIEADEAEPAETPVEAVEREAPSPQAPLPDSAEAGAVRRPSRWPYILLGLAVLGAAAVFLIRRGGKRQA